MRLSENPYVRDLLAQPEALAATLEGFPDPAALDGFAPVWFDRIVLTGMGGSFHSLHVLNLRLISTGLAPVMVETSELVHSMAPLLDGGTLVIAVSQSGRSAETVRLIEMARRRAAILAVTNTPDSPLAAAADFCVLTRAGEEATVSSKTYVATVAALEWLGAALSGGDAATLRGDVEDMRTYLQGWESHVASFGPLLEGVRHVFLAGRGASLAAAGTGGLIVKESAHFPTEGMSAAAFRHGPLEMAGPGAFLLVFAGGEPTAHLNRRLAEAVRSAGARAELIAPDAELPALRVAPRPVLEILPVQMLSLALALRTGHEPGRFMRAAKVTSEE